MTTDTQKIILIKLKAGAADEIIDRVEESNQQKGNRYYNVRGVPNEDIIKNLDKKMKYHCLFVVYKEADDLLAIQVMYWGTCEINDQLNLHFEVPKKLDNDWMIKNAASYLELDIQNDFPTDGQVSIEFSPSLVDYLDYIRNPPYVCPAKKPGYCALLEETGLSPLAQKNEYCQRRYGIREPMEGRSEYQRDYDRIIHSKAFRRMADKAQIFTASKGDYYRNRLTHSLIVCQIAKAIATRLKLNLYLTEAVALGHDLGHTPFGHQGERTLNSILTGQIKSPQNPLPEDECKDKAYGGFKHNYQSLRVASTLEEAYIEADGLDLSYQTLEGMFKHTKIDQSKYKLEEFLTSDDEIKAMCVEKPFSATLEGQTVAIADEIAQRCHDLEDAFSAKIMTIDILLESLQLRKARTLYDRVKKIQDNIAEVKNQSRKVADEDALLHKEISSAVVDYLVDDVVTCTEGKMRGMSPLPTGAFTANECLVCFSEGGKTVCDYLEKIISKQVINSVEVSQFDDCGERVVLGLFGAYYRNPKLLHIGTVRRIYHEMQRQNIQNLIDFETGDYKIVRNEWARITKSVDVEQEQEGEYKLKRKILVRAICDFISGMTDTYAIMEYKKICDVML